MTDQAAFYKAVDATLQLMQSRVASSLQTKTRARWTVTYLYDSESYSITGVTRTLSGGFYTNTVQRDLWDLTPAEGDEKKPSPSEVAATIVTAFLDRLAKDSAPAEKK